MPLWKRLPNPTRVRQLDRHLVTFLRHWEMMIPEPDRGRIREGMIELANATPVSDGVRSDTFINTTFAAGSDWTGRPWEPIWQTHQPDEFLCALLYGAIFRDVMINHPYNWISWRPDEEDFGIVRERRDCSCYGDHQLGEVMGLTYMRVAEPPDASDERRAIENLLRACENRRTR